MEQAMWILSNWKLVAGIAGAVAFLTLCQLANYYHGKSQRLEKENAVLSSQLESITKNTQKVIYVKSKVAAMPASAVVDELQTKFSRD